MPSFSDLQDFFSQNNIHLIIAADAEPVTSKKAKNKLTEQIPAGGVAVALNPTAKAGNGIYIARGKTEEDKEAADQNGEIILNPNTVSSYLLKRLFFTEEETDAYYLGFSNQTLWPLSHVCYQRPQFRQDWFEIYKKVNQRFANAIQEKLQDNTVVWVNDYQLALVPSLIKKKKNTAIGFFWHIPWPTWEIFRILPQKIAILEGMLAADFIGFHRGYHVRNFIETVSRELEARIDRETNTIYYKNHKTTVRNLPMGIDTDVIEATVAPEAPDTIITAIARALLGIEKETQEEGERDIDTFFKQNKVILGVDRLDYTKGLRTRLKALDIFFEEYPKHIGNVSYMGILAPSREKIPAYQLLKKEVFQLAKEINDKYKTPTWEPIHLVSGVYSRDEILNMYRKAAICLVTPLDDGMNLVSKEFITAASLSDNPGVLVLSQFAGSAIDLTDALIVNPYDTKEVAMAIQNGLTMSKDERMERTQKMSKVLRERNVYGWAVRFLRNTMDAAGIISL